VKSVSEDYVKPVLTAHTIYEGCGQKKTYPDENCYFSEMVYFTARFFTIICKICLHKPDEFNEILLTRIEMATI